MIQLQGNYGEGGGALIRTALALSVLTGQSFEVNNIRAGRPEPGLKAQHLTAINALKKICDAKTNDINIGSTDLKFIPGIVKSGTYEMDIGTAGSISLLLQALLLPCLSAKGKIILKIKGGTCGKWQASVDYLQNVFFPQLSRFAEKLEMKILKRGYYPKGGGEVQIIIMPKEAPANIYSFQEICQKIPLITLAKQGTLEQIRGDINLSVELQEKEVAERIKLAAESALKKYNAPITIRTEYVKTPSVGGEAVLWALFSEAGKINFNNPVILGSDALIEQGKRSEEIGKEAAQKLTQEISSFGAVDHFLTDQLIPLMGLMPASELLSSQITNHAHTNMYVTEKFLKVRFRIIGKTIKVELENKSF